MFLSNKDLQRWLILVAVVHIVAGIALPIFAYSTAFDFYSDRLGEVFWIFQEVPQETKEFQRWIVALFGPTIASWGVLMAYLVKTGAKTNEPWPWNVLLLAIVLWAPADIGISLLHNFWLHVQIDVFAVLAIVPPTLLLRARAIKNQKRRYK